MAESGRKLVIFGPRSRGELLVIGSELTRSCVSFRIMDLSPGPLTLAAVFSIMVTAGAVCSTYIE